MFSRPRLLTKDEELGKRDDDFKARRPTSSGTPSALLPWMWRKRRLLLAVTTALLLLYLITQEDLKNSLVLNKSKLAGDAQLRHNLYTGPTVSELSRFPSRKGTRVQEEVLKNNRNGQVRFYRLGQSLHQISSTMGAKPENRNILFAAFSLKSAANLMPMACEMAKAGRNYPHMAIFGMSELSVAELLEVNGVDQNECKVYFHDARVGPGQVSSPTQAEFAVKSAMRYINDFMHPQAIIMDDSTKENPQFTIAMRAKAKEIARPLIEIPAGRYEQFLWMSKLDAGSLGNWFKPTIEIVIHAQPGSSGSLIRLIQSLYNADYKGLRVPRLTIDLPNNVDGFLLKYLHGLQWPPHRADSQSNQLTLRHRINSLRISSEQASIRFLESFYPANPQDNHVLILSSQAEAGSLYLHYLQFAILEYHYAAYGPRSLNLLGISLDVPSSYLNGSSGFHVPTLGDTIHDESVDARENAPHEPAPFLYQGISSSAHLVFGDKWAIYHDFLAKRILAPRHNKQDRIQKTVSESEPAWVEYLLELMRARAWSVLYPAISFITIHNELAQIPEEFIRPTSNDELHPEVSMQSSLLEEEPFALAADTPTLIQHDEVDTNRGSMPLHRMLPFHGELRDLLSLPHLTHEGVMVRSQTLDSMKDEYVPWFRAVIGGCQEADARRGRIQQLGSTDDLFCLPGTNMRFVDQEESESDKAALAAESTIEPALESEVRKRESVTESGGVADDLPKTTARSTVNSGTSPDQEAFDLD